MNNNIEELKALENGKVFKCMYKEDNSTKFRVEKISDTAVFVFKPKCSNRGWHYSIENFIKYFDFDTKQKKQEDKTKSWHNRLKRAIKCMTESGLWQNIKTKFENLLKMTYEEKEDLYKLYWKNEEQAKQLAKEKYNFMIRKNEDNKEYLDTDYIFEISNCDLKSMYFGRKYINTAEKETIKEKLKNKEKYHCFYRTNYDTSFEYNAEKQLAWYSEEYKNCGNGHYYLALDHSTALFCEDD